MSKLNILHIGTFESHGGAAKVGWRLSEAQRACGHSSNLLVANRNLESQYSDLINTGVDNSRKYNCINNGQLYYEYEGSHDIIYHDYFKRAAVLNLHNLHGDYFNPFSVPLLAAQKPVVWTLHDMQSLTGHCAHSMNCEKWNTECSACPDLNLYPALQVDTTKQLFNDKKYIYDNSEFNVVVPSNWLKEKVEKSILKNHKVELIYNGINTKTFSPLNKDEIRKKYNIPAGVKIIGNLAVGGLSNSWKGGKFTLEIMANLLKQRSDVVFLNVGATKEIDFPNVINIPLLKDEKEIVEAFALMDIFLFTSIAENCPLVVIEAISCGVPVVSFGIGGVPEIVQDGIDGLIVKPGDTTSALEQINFLFENPEKLKEFGRNARSRALTVFDHDKIADKYEQFYLTTIDDWNKNKKKLSENFLNKTPEIVKTENFLKAFNHTIKEINRMTVENNKSNNALIEEAIESGDFTSAIKLLQEIVNEEPGNTEALNNLAVVLSMLGDNESAVRALNLVLKVDPYNKIAKENMTTISA